MQTANAARRLRGALLLPPPLLLALLGALPGAAAQSNNCSVDTFTPIAGPSAGGTLVRVSGAGFGDGSAWLCSFGDTLVGAELEGSDVACFAPEHAPATVGFNVSVDGGGSWCDGGHQFAFYSAPNVTSISPASGSVQGATDVTVRAARRPCARPTRREPSSLLAGR